MLRIRLLEHHLHEVNTIAELSDTMLDLQPRIHLQKEKLPRLIIHQILDRPRRPILDRLGQQHRRLPQLLPQPLPSLHKRTRTLLHDLLMPPLNRALPLPKMHGRPFPIPKHLHLHMPCARVVPLHKHAAVLEQRLPAPAHAPEPLPHFPRVRARREPHPAAAARRLEHDGVAERVRSARRGGGVGDQAGRAGHDGHAGARGEGARGVLDAEGGEGVRAGADPGEAGGCDDGGEVGVFGEELRVLVL